MAGLLTALNPDIAQNPMYQGFDQRRNAIAGFGQGLIGGSAIDKMRNASAGAMQGRQVDTAYQVEQQKQQQAQNQLNQTIEAFRRSGRDDLVQAVQGGLPMKDAWGEYLSAQQSDPTSAIKNYEFLVNSGVSPDDAMKRAFSGGTTVNVGGDGSPGLGKLSTDYGYKVDEQGNPIIDPETNLPMAAAVPGSPAWQEAQQADVQSAQRDQQTSRSANIVLDDIGRARDVVKNDAPWNPAVGLGSGLARNIEESNATNLFELTQSIRGNIGFDRLQQMREASPTGGALGQVTERELATLQAVMGSLEQSQSEDQFLYNLDRLEGIYNEILRKASAYPNAEKFGFDAPPGAAAGGGNSDPLGIRY